MASVIIPTFNAGDSFGELLSLLKRSPSVDEIVIIDSSSTDGTAGIGRAHEARVITIEKEQFSHADTRTSGGQAAKGDVLVYMTQDAMPVDEHSIDTLVKSITENPEVGAAYGRQLPSPGASPFAAHLRLFNYPPEPAIRSYGDHKTLGLKAVFFSNSFAAYRRSALEDIGWFIKGLSYGEDVTAAAQILMSGHKLAYASDAAVYHSHNFTPIQEFLRYRKVGAFHGQEKWLIKEFGGATGEGFRYVRSEIKYLIDKGLYHLIPISTIRNACKYLGYRLGRMSLGEP